MSIYATWLSFDGEDHEESCACMIPDGDIPHCFSIDASKGCTCRAKFEQPLIYQGSHVSPSDEDPRGGDVMVCSIPNHCHPDVRFSEPYDDSKGKLVDFLRLSVREDPKTYKGGHPGDATVILTRPLVTELRDTLTRWLEAEERW